MKKRNIIPTALYRPEINGRICEVRYRPQYLIVRLREGTLGPFADFPFRSEESRRNARELTVRKLQESKHLKNVDFTVLSPPGFRTIGIRINEPIDTVGLALELKREGRLFDGVGIDLVAEPSSVPGYEFVAGNPVEQWGLEAVHLFEAWELQTDEIPGGEPVILGLLDYGIPIKDDVDPASLSQGTRLTDKLDHEDLDGSRFLAGRNCGYGLDDARAYWPMEEEGGNHGTMMAGIIAATPNNGIGIAGVNWKSDIYASLVMGKDEHGADLSTQVSTLVGVQDAALYALSVEKKLVVNLSLRFLVKFDPGFDLTDVVVLVEGIFGMFEAVKAADAVVAVAAGNYFETRDVPGLPVPGPGEPDYYLEYPALAVARNPAYADHFLITGAIGEGGDLWYNSGRGEPEMVFAPGDNINTTTNRTLDKYDAVDGTSPAAAHVSALAALLWREDPTLDAGDIVRCIKCTAREMIPGSGHRVIDAAAAFHTLKSEMRLLTASSLSVEDAEPGTCYALPIRIDVFSCGTATMQVTTSPAGCFGLVDGEYPHDPGENPFTLTAVHCAQEDDPEETTGTVEILWVEQGVRWEIGIRATRAALGPGPPGDPVPL